jgi:Arc/MetJ-type ribon-helix-helix transcriptional regulator
MGLEKESEVSQMKNLALEVPDRVAAELEKLVRAGWFATEEEAVRLALAEFLQRNKLRLQEEQQMEDIRWALELKDAAR